MSHDHHEGLPGYSPAQLFHDGCGECEARGANLETALSFLDTADFQRAWDRALAFEAGTLRDVSGAEAHLLRVLAIVRFKVAHLRKE